MGLRLDDLLWEENPVMQSAIRRLPAEESYARNYRIMTSHQLSLMHDVLPDSKAIQPNGRYSILDAIHFGG
ncbi:ubiquinol-cytochrome c reductase complex 14 kda protein [Brettanomyces bruxellensis AWRI1499]|nr:ubiquinol-cytochrome c reductase complex 14 kda protein [Brettanomyces bruxellensis AWRI1499]